MNNKITPNIRYREYLAKDVVRVINPKQYKLYIKHGVFPVDIYTIRDYKTDGDLLVMIFMKNETDHLWDAWVNHKLV